MTMQTLLPTSSTVKPDSEIQHDGKSQVALPREQVPEYMLDIIDRYKVDVVPADAIRPSPENEEIYGPINTNSDPALPALMRSIDRIGLEEPIIVTTDSFILSGHRRFAALRLLGWDYIPVRFANVARNGSTDYHRLLAQYNPQRVKSVASVLGEKLLTDTDAGSDSKSWAEYRHKKANPNIKPMVVANTKAVGDIGPRQGEFLEAAIKVIDRLKPYWPLTVRQIHYKLLNDPPLTQATKDRNERWRYRNDLASYGKLSDLLVAARYWGSVPWNAIADSTRETHEYGGGFENTTEFIDRELDGFLQGYYRSRQEGQPNHVEVLIEKNTLVNVVSDICERFHVPFTPLRGYGGPSVWHEVEGRWLDHDSEDAKCILIIISDHDPEGLNLADDAVRSLRDNHDVPVEAIRIAVTLEQVRKFNLPPNPAKESSSRYAEYVKRAGTTKCWECESLDPEDLRQALHDAILSVIDVDQLNAVQECEKEEREQLSAIRKRLGTKLQAMLDEEEQ